MADWATVGCITSSVTLLALAAPGQKADQLKKTAYPTSGRKETTSETTNEKVDDRGAELYKSPKGKRKGLQKNSNIGQNGKICRQT